MTALTALPRALVDSGWAVEPPEKKRKKHKKFKCHKCGGTMAIVDGTNTMACQADGEDPKCNNYYVFK